MKAAALALFCAIIVSAQTPAFEVASIKQSTSEEAGGVCGEFLPGGRFNVTGCRLTFVIAKAYELRNFQVVNAPKWASEWDAPGFRIRAKAADPAGPDQLKLMVQNLLADRFQLRFHREMRNLSALTLTVSKSGPRLRITQGNGNPRGTGRIEFVQDGWLRGKNVFLSSLAEVLASHVGHPVLDKTGFADAIDFSLRWTPDDTAGGPGGPSIFTANQEQLGLKLEPDNDPIEVLVIDSVEHPTPN